MWIHQKNFLKIKELLYDNGVRKKECWPFILKLTFKFSCHFLTEAKVFKARDTCKAVVNSIYITMIMGIISYWLFFWYSYKSQCINVIILNLVCVFGFVPIHPPPTILFFSEDFGRSNKNLLLIPFLPKYVHIHM